MEKTKGRMVDQNVLEQQNLCQPEQVVLVNTLLIAILYRTYTLKLYLNHI